MDLPLEEAEALIGFGLAQAVEDVDAEVPRSLVERAKVSKAMRTATLPTTTASVADIAEAE